MRSEVIFAIIDLLGAFSFAVSGAMAGLKSKMDWFGMFVLACVTTFAGGVMRDCILDVPVIVFKVQNNYVWVCVVATTCVLYFSNIVEKNNKLLMVFDSLGLAIFTVIGTEKSIVAGASFPSAVLLAILTATGGGMVRDVLRDKPPLVLYTDFYAGAALIGSIVFIILKYKLNVDINLATITVTIIVFILRMVVLMIDWKKESTLKRT